MPSGNASRVLTICLRLSNLSTRLFLALAPFLFGFFPSLGSAMINGSAVAGSDLAARNVAQIFVALIVTGPSGSEVEISGRCTATFVTEDILLTANHCVLNVEGLKGFLALSPQLSAKMIGYGRAIGGDGKDIGFKIVDARRMNVTESDPTKAADMALVKINRKFTGYGVPLLTRTLAAGEAVRTFGAGDKVIPPGPSGPTDSQNSPATPPVRPPVVTPEQFKYAAAHQSQALLSELGVGSFQQVSLNDSATFADLLNPTQLEAMKKVLDLKVISLLKKKGGGGLCNGDSGGPSFLKLGHDSVLAGVSADTQAGAETCMGVAIVYQPYAFRTWLDEATHELGEHLRWIK
jgi:hypothetical protein